jgi:recombination protein RecA
MARTSVPMKVRDHPVAKRVESRKVEPKRLLVPSGSVMLNLACSNTVSGAFEAGRMVNLIGDSNSGKTYLALEMLAQCARLKSFNNYELIYDDCEHALSMDIEGLFGSTLANRIMPPATVDNEPKYSRTVEDFHCNFLDALDRGACIYVLDSFDALTSEQDAGKIDDMRDAHKTGKEISGSYRMAKPKKASEILQDTVSKIEKTGSFLLIISQTRDNIDPRSFEKKTRSGGRALKFYASHEIWLAVLGKIRKKERVVGTELKAKVSKNKLTGTFREVGFDFRHGYGCDDITSALDFLIAEKAIKKGEWRDVKFGTMPRMVQEIEDKNMEKLLFKDLQDKWLEIEEALKPNRKSKYE